VAGHQRGAKGQVAVRGKRATRLVYVTVTIPIYWRTDSVVSVPLVMRVPTNEREHGMSQCDTTLTRDMSSICNGEIPFTVLAQILYLSPKDRLTEWAHVRTPPSRGSLRFSGPVRQPRLNPWLNAFKLPPEATGRLTCIQFHLDYIKDNLVGQSFWITISTAIRNYPWNIRHSVGNMTGDWIIAWNSR
jgi:hypothetical protein